MMKIEQNRVHHLSDRPVNQMDGGELAVILVLQKDRQLDLAGDENLIDVRRHQSFLMTLRGSAHHFRYSGRDTGSFLRLFRGIGRRVGRRRGGAAAARTRRADQKIVSAVDGVSVACFGNLYV